MNMNSLVNKTYQTYNISNFSTTIYPIYNYYSRNYYFFDKLTGDCKTNVFNYIPDPKDLPFQDYEECSEECIKSDGKILIIIFFP